ncbi:hypothetical protein QFZ49_006663 [Streptomyces turgidiscabies]|uniref:Transposase n=1 Tax=Streptomyces turgidiscabies TaxID=85558 RepID=A0ABU0RYA2_9ACTN|nr:hypothetical protein [Streptomyces turgidiscabies]
MGLCLFPGDEGVDGLDACFSYGGFAQFRRRLALAEGFSLDERVGQRTALLSCPGWRPSSNTGRRKSLAMWAWNDTSRTLSGW